MKPVLKYIAVLALLFAATEVAAQASWSHKNKWDGNIIPGGIDGPQQTIYLDPRRDGTANGTPVSEVELIVPIKLVTNSPVSGNRNPGKMRIVNQTNRQITIKVCKNMRAMFEIEEGCGLTIDGGTAGIVLDGGANLIWSGYGNSELKDANPDLYPPNHNYTEANMKSMNYGIYTKGTLTLTNVTIRNVRAVKGDLTNAEVLAGNSGSDNGAITINNANGQTTLTRCTIERCKAANGVAMHVSGAGTSPTASQITFDGCLIQHCYGDPHPSVYGNGWGGIIRTIGGWKGNLVMKNTTVRENFTHLDCAGLFWNALGDPSTKCTLDDCTFARNKTLQAGGGIRIETNIEFVGNPTIVEGNWAEEIGGGIHGYGYAGPNITTKSNINHYLSDKLIVRNNGAKVAGGGFGLQFDEACNLPAETAISTHVNGVILSGNTAGKNGDGVGGGIYFYNSTPAAKNYVFKIYLNSGEVTNNKALDGAGVYVAKADLLCELDDDVLIQDNEAGRDGGGIFLRDGVMNLSSVYVQRNKADRNGGGLFIQDGTMHLVSGHITGNQALMADGTNGGCGGGVMIQEGSFEIELGEVMSNTAMLYGGGLFAYSDPSVAGTHPVTLSGGRFLNNAARAGGGIAAAGTVQLDVKGVDVLGNHADNGGGIMITDGATMDYHDGMVRQNYASKAYTGTLTTGFEGTLAELKGFGGGIYVARNATLDLTHSTGSKFGIYSNEALTGGDDIFATGLNTHVLLPKVSTMQLTDFAEMPVAPGSLYWVEDYMTNDTAYDKGSYKNSDWQGKNLRYRDALRLGVQAEVPFFKLDESIAEDLDSRKYISLALGYVLSHLRIEKEGLREGESAIFSVAYETSGVQNHYLQTVLTGKADGSTVSTLIFVPYGIWTVTETPWSWGYTPEGATAITHVVNDKNTDPIFRFVNTPKSETPPHDEAIKRNDFTHDDL